MQPTFVCKFLLLKKKLGKFILGDIHFTVRSGKAFFLPRRKRQRNKLPLNQIFFGVFRRERRGKEKEKKVKVEMSEVSAEGSVTGLSEARRCPLTVSTLFKGGKSSRRMTALMTSSLTFFTGRIRMKSKEQQKTFSLALN